MTAGWSETIAGAAIKLLHINSARPTIGDRLNWLSGLGLNCLMLGGDSLEQDHCSSGKAEQHYLITDAFAIFHEV
jgi:hypothetical protein